MFYLISEASHRAVEKGLKLSADAFRVAVKRRELLATTTAGGVRLISENDLDAFIEARKAKRQKRKKMTTQSKAA